MVQTPCGLECAWFDPHEKRTPAMNMSKPNLLMGIGLIFSLVYASPSQAQCVGFEFCKLVWSDEFDGTEVNTEKWSFQRGDGSEVFLPSGWGNNEQQWYTDQNAAVADGLLTITAREESVEPGWRYTSARLRSRNKGDWTYGRMEMRAKMPLGKGLWPAFWMLPSDRGYGGWAASGEIDIVEYIGSNPGEIFGTIHYGGEWPMNVSSSSQYSLPSGTFDQDFHEFAIEWEEGEIRWYVDDVHYGTKTDWYSSGGDFPAPFDVDFHLLLNMAVGGNLPGAPNSNTQFPQEYVIDYVRVYEESDGPIFSINPGLNDAWFNPATNGQGFLLSVFPVAKLMFLAWFTYDTERPAGDTQTTLGDPGHRWLTAQGPYDGNTASLTIYSTEGGVFDSPEPVATTDPEGVGLMTVEFSDCRQGVITYEFSSPGISGEIPIQRVANDNVAFCEALSGTASQ
jgi:beta-glucanase (GH16 family)